MSVFPTLLFFVFPSSNLWLWVFNVLFLCLHVFTKRTQELCSSSDEVVHVKRICTEKAGNWLHLKNWLSGETALRKSAISLNVGTHVAQHEARSVVISHVVYVNGCFEEKKCKSWESDKYPPEERKLFGGTAIVQKGGERLSLWVCKTEYAGAVNIHSPKATRALRGAKVMPDCTRELLTCWMLLQEFCTAFLRVWNHPLDVDLTVFPVLYSCRVHEWAIRYEPFGNLRRLVCSRAVRVKTGLSPD